jgi:hypothetical protein
MTLFEKLNETGIPKFFWYTVSFVILVGSIMLLWLSYKSQSISIEVADTKIQLITSINQVEKTYETLRTHENKISERIKELNKAHTRPSVTEPELKIDKTEVEESMSKLKDIKKYMQQLK